jgi:hypothetical protein
MRVLRDVRLGLSSAHALCACVYVCIRCGWERAVYLVGHLLEVGERPRVRQRVHRACLGSVVLLGHGQVRAARAQEGVGAAPRLPPFSEREQSTQHTTKATIVGGGGGRSLEKAGLPAPAFRDWQPALPRLTASSTESDPRANGGSHHPGAGTHAAISKLHRHAPGLTAPASNPPGCCLAGHGLLD